MICTLCVYRTFKRPKRFSGSSVDDAIDDDEDDEALDDMYATHTHT